MLPDRKKTMHNLKRLDDKGARSRGSVEFFIFSVILLGLTGGERFFDTEMNRTRSARSLALAFCLALEIPGRERFLLEISPFLPLRCCFRFAPVAAVGARVSLKATKSIKRWAQRWKLRRGSLSSANNAPCARVSGETRSCCPPTQLSFFCGGPNYTAGEPQLNERLKRL